MKNDTEKTQQHVYLCLTALGILVLAFVFFLSFSAYIMDDGDLLLGLNEVKGEEIINETSELLPDLKFYIAGEYLVGRDIPAGDYVITDATSISISTAATETGDKITISEDQALGHYYVRINDNETLSVTDGQINTLDSSIPVEQSEYSNGIYLIGRDLPPGSYQVTSDGNGFLERRNSPFSTSDQTTPAIETQNFDRISQVTLNEGEYIKLSSNSKLLKR